MYLRNRSSQKFNTYSHRYVIRDGRMGILTDLFLCATVLCTIMMVHNGTNSSYKPVDWFALRSCLV